MLCSTIASDGSEVAVLWSTVKIQELHSFMCNDHSKDFVSLISISESHSKDFVILISINERK